MLMPLSGWQEGHMNRKAVPLIPNGSLSKHVEEENCCSCHPLAALPPSGSIKAWNKNC